MPAFRSPVFLAFDSSQTTNQQALANENTEFAFSRGRIFFFGRNWLRPMSPSPNFRGSGVGVLTGCSGARDGGPSGSPFSYVLYDRGRRITPLP